jgi:hypothetical protein
VGSDLPHGVFGFFHQLFDSIYAMGWIDLRHGVNRFTPWCICSQKVCQVWFTPLLNFFGLKKCLWYVKIRFL